MSEEHSDDGIELTAEEREQIDHYHTLRTEATFYELLGVPTNANRKAVRDAYFDLSKRYHPDVFFKKNLGPYKQKLDDNFRAFTKAFDILSTPKQRFGYDLLIGVLQEPAAESPKPSIPAAAESPSTPPSGFEGFPVRETIDLSGLGGAADDGPSHPEPSPMPPPRVSTATASTPPGPHNTSASIPPASATRTATSSTPPSSPPVRPPTVAPPPMAAQPVSSVRSVRPMASGDVPLTPTAPVPQPVTRQPRQYTDDEVGERPVVPPPLRSAIGTNPGGATVPQRSASAVSPPVDNAARQRALEAMARKLTGAGVATKATDSQNGVVVPQTSFPKVAPPDPQTILAEKRAQADQIVAKGEEAQKSGNLQGALELYRSALNVLKDDEGIKARVDQLSNLLVTQQVNASIEQARDAMRKGKAEESARHWEKAWEGRPSDLNLLLNAADVIAKHTKEHRRAIELCQKIVLADPKNIKALSIMARTFIDAGLRASARGAIENVAKLEPPNSPIVKELRDKLGPLTIAEQLGLRK